MPAKPNRPTTLWVPIDRLVPHPRNSNQMSAEAQQKLGANILATGRYPPIVVRSMELTEDFKDEKAADKFQILDGEHRWLQQKAAGAEVVHIDVWAGITDAMAYQALLTLNSLRGKDDGAKRNQLIRLLADTVDVTDMAEMLPEDEERIRETVDAQTETAINDAMSRAEGLRETAPITFFVTDDQATVIRAAITRWLDLNDPDEKVVECREGYALQAICEPHLD